MKKRKYLIVCGCIFLLLIIVNWRNINSFLADKSISWIDKAIDKQQTIMFRSNRIDSLYVKNNYKYYLFINGEWRNDGGIMQKLPHNSVLAIKPLGLSPVFIKEPFDTISLPASVIELMVKKDEEMALCQVLSANKDSVGYSYRLKRINVSK